MNQKPEKLHNSLAFTIDNHQKSWTNVHAEKVMGKKTSNSVPSYLKMT